MEPRRPSRASSKQASASSRASRSSTGSRRSTSDGSRRRPNTSQAALPESSSAAAAEGKTVPPTAVKPPIPVEAAAAHGTAKALGPGLLPVPTTSASSGQGAIGPTQSVPKLRHLGSSQPPQAEMNAPGEKPKVTLEDARPRNKRLFTLGPSDPMVFEFLFGLTGLSDAATGGKTDMQGRPSDMMALCLTARPSDDSGSLNSFKEFLAKTVSFLNTSEDSATYAQLLEALVVLSSKWLVPLWFRLDVISGVVVIQPEPLVSVWRRLHVNLQPTYSSYVERFIDVVYEGGRNFSQAVSSYLTFLRKRSEAVQATVFQRLSVTESGDSPIPVNGHVSDLEMLAPQFAASAWLAAISRAYDTQKAATLTVYVSARELLDAMSRLVSSTSALELLHHTHWWFVQQIGALASNALFSATGSAFGGAGSVYQSLLCTIQVSVTYAVLLASMHASRFLSAERKAVEDIRRTVHLVTVEKLRSADNLAKFQLDSLISLLADDADPVVWPLPSTFDAVLMERLYGGRPDGSRAFFGYWLSSREQLARSFGSYPHNVASQFYKVDPSSLSIYNPVVKKVAVATAALDSPLYYRQGTAAMAYGGLGFQYAMRLVRVMDDRKLSDAGIWQESPVGTDEDRLAMALSCSDEREKVRAFPFLPALAVAHGAYEKMVNGSEETRLKGLEHYTAEQVFFMSACLSLCQADEANNHWSSGCNAAVRNYAPFANAFRCHLGSGMNRRDKCTFLTG